MLGVSRGANYYNMNKNKELRMAINHKNIPSMTLVMDADKEFIADMLIDSLCQRKALHEMLEASSMVHGLEATYDPKFKNLTIIDNNNNSSSSYTVDEQEDWWNCGWFLGNPYDINLCIGGDFNDNEEGHLTLYRIHRSGDNWSTDTRDKFSVSISLTIKE